jgi:hypothetical protein
MTPQELLYQYKNNLLSSYQKEILEQEIINARVEVKDKLLIVHIRQKFDKNFHNTVEYLKLCGWLVDITKNDDNDDEYDFKLTGKVNSF